MRALQCLTSDEAAFVHAACARVLDLGDSRSADLAGAGAVQYLDRKLDCQWEPVDDGQCRDTLSRPTLYKTGIAAVQWYCLHVHDASFQMLRPDIQDSILAMLEEGEGVGAMGHFQMLTSMLVADAVESFFDASDMRCDAVRYGECEQKLDCSGLAHSVV